MNGAQVTMIVLIATELLLSLEKHGETKEINFWGALIGAAIEVGILKWGGFF